MIATIGLLGSNTFEAVRVGTRAEAEEFFAAWRELFGGDQQHENAWRQRDVLPEKVGRTVRWRDGSRALDRVQNFSDWLAGARAERTERDRVCPICGREHPADVEPPFCFRWRYDSSGAKEIMILSWPDARAAQLAAAVKE